MPARPLSQCLRSRYLTRRPLNVQGFSTRSNLRGGGGGDHYDPPTGWLFGVKPGEKYQKEGWENAFYFGFVGSLVIAGIAYVFKPDTSYVETTHLPLLPWSNLHLANYEALYCFVISMRTSLANISVGYKRGPWKKPAGGWKPKVSWRTQIRHRRSKISWMVSFVLSCTLYIDLGGW